MAFLSPRYGQLHSRAVKLVLHPQGRGRAGATALCQTEARLAQGTPPPLGSSPKRTTKVDGSQCPSPSSLLSVPRIPWLQLQMGLLIFRMTATKRGAALVPRVLMLVHNQTSKNYAAQDLKNKTATIHGAQVTATAKVPSDR